MNNIKLFKKWIKRTEKNMKLIYGEILDIKKLNKEAEEIFLKYQDKIPDIGERNIWKENQICGYIYLSFYKALKNNNFTIEQSGKFLLDLNESFFKSYNPVMRKIYNIFYFSKFNKKNIKKAAKTSKRKLYKNDWVFEYVDGNSEYDFGFDIYECALCKIYESENALEILPYLCHVDYLMGNYFNQGFSRNTILSVHKTKCDCRYKKGKNTEIPEAIVNFTKTNS